MFITAIFEQSELHGIAQGEAQYPGLCPNLTLLFLILAKVKRVRMGKASRLPGRRWSKERTRTETPLPK